VGCRIKIAGFIPSDIRHVAILRQVAICLVIGNAMVCRRNHADYFRDRELVFLQGTMVDDWAACFG
jgi:hypothetical protein